MATLYELSRSKVVRAHRLQDGVFTIGREAQCRIVVKGRSISRRHCRLVVAQSRALVFDEGSANGTFLDGTAVSEAAPLVDGSRLRIGATTLVYRTDPSDEMADDARRPESGRGFEFRIWWASDSGEVRFGWHFGPSAARSVERQDSIATW